MAEIISLKQSHTSHPHIHMHTLDTDAFDSVSDTKTNDTKCSVRNINEMFCPFEFE